MNWLEFKILEIETVILVLVDEILSKSKSIFNYEEFINY